MKCVINSDLGRCCPRSVVTRAVGTSALVSPLTLVIWRRRCQGPGTIVTMREASVNKQDRHETMLYDTQRNITRFTSLYRDLNWDSKPGRG